MKRRVIWKSEFTEKKMIPEFYASIDCEFDGTNPVQHSMLAYGVAIFAFRESHEHVKPLATCYAKLLPQHGATQKESTMRNFWDKNPAAWKEVTTNMQTPESAMSQVAQFLQDFMLQNPNSKLKFIATPGAQDWMFFKTYYDRYAPPDSFDIGFYCEDFMPAIREYCKFVRIKDVQTFYKTLAENNTYDHTALHDAIYQGVAYINFRFLSKKITL